VDGEAIVADNSMGFTQWDVKFFYDFVLGGTAHTLETPGKLTWSKPGRAPIIPLMSGGTVHQGVYLGGDAPVNISRSEFSMDFSVFHKEGYYNIIETVMKTAVTPQDFFAGIRIPDVWYIPARVSGQTIWKTSRYLPFDTFDITDAEYTPECYIDGVEQTRDASSPPAATKFYIEPGVESAQVELPSGISGTWLVLWYPARMLLGQMAVDETSDDENQWDLTLDCIEHLPSRDYTFTVP
jgi:hypothetical protein